MREQKPAGSRVRPPVWRLLYPLTFDKLNCIFGRSQDRDFVPDTRVRTLELAEHLGGIYGEIFHDDHGKLGVVGECDGEGAPGEDDDRREGGSE